MKNILALCMLSPLTLFAMNTGEVPTNTHAFSDEIIIRATASFFSRSEGKRKQFSRFIAPRSLICDALGNVDVVDVLNISIKTNKLSPMFQVTMKPLAINERYNQINIACTTSNQDNEAQTQTIELLMPLNTKYLETRNLTLYDDANQPVVLSIETWPNLQAMNNNS